MIRSGRTRSAALATSALLLTLALGACGQEGTDPDPTPGPTQGEETADPGDGTDDENDTASDDPDDAAATSEDDMSTDGPIATHRPDDSALPTGGVTDAVLSDPDVQAAVRAEAERAGVGTDEVEVVGYAEVTWRDGSLGCPQPGQVYTMALVDGRQLVLEVDGTLASYHGKDSGPLSYCANPQPPTGGGPATS